MMTPARLRRQNAAQFDVIGVCDLREIVTEFFEIKEKQKDLFRSLFAEAALDSLRRRLTKAEYNAFVMTLMQRETEDA